MTHWHVQSCERGSGILLHISSLPSRYGIGTFGEAAYKFVDFLAESGQQYWQILPLGMTDCGNSPYKCCSAFAGNMYFIDLDRLSQAGYLNQAALRDIDWGDCEARVDYDKLYSHRAAVLRQAAQTFPTDNADYIAFCRSSRLWLEDFALFMAIKQHQHRRRFDQWDKRYRLRDQAAVGRFIESHASDIAFYKITQFWFYEQLHALKTYANSRGIRIIGDIPFYIAYDSADVWAAPGLFELDERLMPKNVAGVPPDMFSVDGQLWGNPLYDYAVMRKDGYQWWRRRVAQCFLQCDILRIDHFRAIDSYYAIPYPSPNAKNGEWRKGEGMAFIDALGFKDKAIIVEDLGDMNDSVKELIQKTGLPNMKILQFAFDNGRNNAFLPRHYTRNCVVYTGTHDNNTVKGWYKTLSLKEKLTLAAFVPSSLLTAKSGALIRYAQRSRANIAIIPLQDYLNLDETARMNRPSTLNNNWEWRVESKQLNTRLKKRIKKLSRR